MSYPWPDVRVDRLRALWAEGWSASQAALVLNAEFGAYEALTKNAVVGKVHRLGLPSRVPRYTANRQPKRARRAAEAAKRSAGPKPSRSTICPLRTKPLGVKPLRSAIPPVEVTPVMRANAWKLLDGAAGIPFLDRAPWQCAWPCWDAFTLIAERLCCGLPIDYRAGQPYCAAHAQINRSTGTTSERTAVRDAARVPA